MSLHDTEIAKNKDLIKFKIKYERDKFEDILSYNKMLEYLVECETNYKNGALWEYCWIIGHQHTPVGHRDCKGSNYNVSANIRVTRAFCHY